MPEQHVDKELRCVECGEDFTFTAQEQQFFAEKGFTNEPKRCPPCRAAKKKNSAKRDFEHRDGPREMHEAKCADCGQTARVPFKPRGDRPVYCSDCFAKRR